MRVFRSLTFERKIDLRMSWAMYVKEDFDSICNAKAFLQDSLLFNNSAQPTMDTIIEYEDGSIGPGYISGARWRQIEMSDDLIEGLTDLSIYNKSAYFIMRALENLEYYKSFGLNLDGKVDRDLDSLAKKMLKLGRYYPDFLVNFQMPLHPKDVIRTLYDKLVEFGEGEDRSKAVITLISGYKKVPHDSKKRKRISLMSKEIKDIHQFAILPE